MCQNLFNEILKFLGFYNLIITRENVLTESNSLINGHYYQFFNRLRSTFSPQHKVAIVKGSDEKLYVFIANNYHRCNVLMELDEFTSVLAAIVNYDFVLSGSADTHYLTIHPVHLCDKNK